MSFILVVNKHIYYPRLSKAVIRSLLFLAIYCKRYLLLLLNMSWVIKTLMLPLALKKKDKMIGLVTIVSGERN